MGHVARSFAAAAGFAEKLPDAGFGDATAAAIGSRVGGCAGRSRDAHVKCITEWRPGLIDTGVHSAGIFANHWSHPLSFCGLRADCVAGLDGAERGAANPFMGRSLDFKSE